MISKTKHYNEVLDEKIDYNPNEESNIELGENTDTGADL